MTLSDCVTIYFRCFFEAFVAVRFWRHSKRFLPLLSAVVAGLSPMLSCV